MNRRADSAGTSGDGQTASRAPPEADDVDKLRDAKRTRANILAAGRSVFAEKGFSGAKVSEIVTLAQTTKPMIYYHFGSKEGLFAAVLEDVYTGMRDMELSAHIADVPPLEAMRRLVELTFDYHAAHPEWIRLISDENIHGAEHIARSVTVAGRSSAVVGILENLLRRGVESGVFRPGIDPVHLHLLIASFCFYRVSNRHTWKVIFHRDLGGAAEAARQRTVIVEAALAYLRPEAGVA